MIKNMSLPVGSGQRDTEGMLCSRYLFGDGAKVIGPRPSAASVIRQYLEPR